MYFSKCEQILKILLPEDIWPNVLCSVSKTSTSPDVCCYTTLWKVQKCDLFWCHLQCTVAILQLPKYHYFGKQVAETCQLWCLLECWSVYTMGLGFNFCFRLWFYSVLLN